MAQQLCGCQWTEGEGESGSEEAEASEDEQGNKSQTRLQNTVRSPPNESKDRGASLNFEATN